jgi:methylthioribose-1-phosphate isomerase
VVHVDEIEPVRWRDGEVQILDQRLLPAQEVWLPCRRAEDVAVAIRDMAIRGAPAIGVAAALGLALGLLRSEAAGPALEAEMRRLCALLAATRPTAVNLFWAIDRMSRRFATLQAAGGGGLREGLLAEALAIRAEDVQACRTMGDLGAELIPDGARLLTHCNAGALATAGYGTALGVIRSAARRGKLLRVYADETRPYLQGARLTAWELTREGIPTTLIADNAAGHLLAQGEIDAVVVGADRIAANGDVANKIGTYTVAVLAHEQGIPFYVAAPVSTIDLATASGRDIPIEERPEEEVTHHGGRRLAPEGVSVRNPAFDVTPHRYVSAIVCERGVARAPYTETLRALVRGPGGEEPGPLPAPQPPGTARRSAEAERRDVSGRDPGDGA